MDAWGRGIADAADLFANTTRQTFDRNVISRDPFTENQWTGDAFQDTAYDDLFGASTRDAYSASTALTLNDAYNGVGSMLGSWYGPSTFGGSGTGTAPSWQSGLPKLHPWDEDESSQGGYRDITGGIEGWLASKMPWLYDTTVPIGGAGGGGPVGEVGAGYEILDGFNDEITQAVRQVYAETGIMVPGNLAKAMLYREGGGKGLRNEAYLRGERVYGFNGIFQSTASSWGIDYDRMLRDDGYAVYALVLGLAKIANYEYQGKQTLSGWGWSGVASTYFSGNPLANGWTDELGNVSGGGGPNDYVNGPNGVITQANLWDQMAGGTGNLGSVGLGSSAGSLGSIWGNAPGVSESQGFGMTDFSQTPLGQSYYKNFPPEVWGFEGGHSGRDYNTPYGSKLYSPVSGTVIVAGGTAFYYNDGRPGVAGEGDLRIQLDNGDIVVLGHMSRINVQVGQRIDANTFVGLSGRENGDHVHVEYRLYDPSWNGNPEHLRLVDPASALQGGYTEGGALSARQQTAQTFHDVLRLGMTGQLQLNVPIPYGPLSGVGTQGYNPLLHASILGSLGVNGGTVAAGQPLTFPGANAGSGTPMNPNPGQAGAATAITSLARQYVGSSYVHGGNTPSGWDCSGFVSWVYGQRGVTIPQGSHAQLNGGQSVSWGSLQPGDLMFFDLTGPNGGARAEYQAGNYASHVGMYLGNGMMIHAANENVDTVIVPVDTPYYTDNFLGGRRYT